MKLLDLFKPQQKALTIPVGGMEGANRFSTDRSYIFADTDVSSDVPTFARSEILQMTRYLVNNFPLMERILTLAESYAVNSGILAQAATSDSQHNDEATAYFDKWANNVFGSTTCDVTLHDMQRLCIRELLVAGEVFLVLSNSKTNNYPQLTMVVSEQVRSSGKKADKSQDGIFYDANGKATGYNIYFDKNPVFVDAKDVIHLKRNKQVNQKRGISAFAAALNSVRDVRDLHILEKKAVKLHSTLAAVITKQGDGVIGDGIFGNGRQAKKVAVATSTEVKRQPALEKSLNGAVVYLSEKEKLDLVSSDRSTDGFLKFVELLTRDVCLNLSLPYELVANPTTLSSAATRFVIQDADFLFKSLQHIITTGALNRIYGWVIAQAQNDKKIKFSGEWYQVTWVYPQSATIDAGRKDSGELAFVNNNLESLDTFYSSRGKGWKEELRQVAIEKAYVKELEKEYGINMGPVEIVKPAIATTTVSTIPPTK
jgi:capsid protein